MLQVRWLGRVRYRDAHALQRALFAAPDDYLLLLEHQPVYTLGVRASRANILRDVESLGAEVVSTDRGGDVTYHGPGQLVGYPVLTVPGKRGGGMADTVAFVRGVEQVLIDSLVELGLRDVGRLRDYPGVWVGVSSPSPRKIAAIGVKLTRGRSMHGFALNVTREPLEWFGNIVPCGIADKGVTSLAAEGLDVSMHEVVDVVVRHAAARWGSGGVERADVVETVAAPKPGPKLIARLTSAGVDVSAGLDVATRKPEWMRVKAEMGPEYQRLKRTMRSSSLVTVCEEAGCPNIFECWNQGTATFMINGERCTRACGFCLVDTRHPMALDPGEPERVAAAVADMGLSHAVVTAVARDDLADGGAAAFAETIEAIRRRVSQCAVEVLIPDCKGDPAALEVIFAARPDVLNHNLETVARLQRAVRPSAGYARSLAVLARAKEAGLVTKSGLIVGMGETVDEVRTALRDLRNVGVDIVTVGQYLRPTAAHLPVARWYHPEEFAALKGFAEGELGLRHVESSPLTRSSYHAKEAAGAGAETTVP